MSSNPYIVGNPVGNSPVFVGRTDILREVRRVVGDHQENAIVLYGQRRIGKTSVLQELEALLPKEGAYYPIFFDLQDKAEWSLGRVLIELAHQMSRFLKLAPPDLGNDPETTFRQVWLPDVLNNLPTDASLVLLFDEFDVLDNPDDKQAGAAFFPFLRDLLNTNPNHLNCVFAMGRNIDDLSSIALSLFRNVPAKLVSLLSHEETVQLIHISQNNQTLNLSEDAVTKIWQLTNGHPFLTQALCSHIWDRLHNKNPNEPPTVTSTDVEEAIPDTLSTRRNTLEWLWDGLPPAECVVASTLAGVGARVITDIQLEELLRKSGVQIIIRELYNAPRLLQEWDLIELADGGYRFRVELLRRWIAEYKPPQQAQSELDHLDPAADTLYQAGQKLYRNSHETVAVGPLRQAIALNSNHVGASLLLADILLKQKKVDEAREILEKLYIVRPVAAARTALIQVLLTLGQTTERRKEKRKRYQRILEIEPEHSEAKKQLKKMPKRWQMVKPRQWATNTTGFFNNQYAKITLEVLAFISALLISYYWLPDRIPTEPLIILEVVQPTNEVSEYTITGVISDKPYLLDTVKIIPHCDHPVKQATFKYDIYTQAVDLKVNPNTQPPTYWIDKTSLQQTLAKNDNHFSFEFLDKERFTFYFQFEAPETTLAEFECQVFTADNSNVPCQVRKKGWLSLFRGIPWIVIGSILAIILIVMIERIYAFKKRKHNVGYQKY
jgi:tetratricopeptide (TPR) repeat protein